MSEKMTTKPYAVNDLRFDHANPRLAEYGIVEKTTDSEILEILWDAMDVQELVQSIAASGFFPHESLIVTEEKGKMIVIEGNRRLAALKVLLNPEMAAERNLAIPEISDEARKKLETVPALLSDRESSWRFLGFKHVNGPAKWTSYAKAVYIANVHKKYGISLAEMAEQIGDRHNTVQRMYRGLMVLEQAERERVYNREKRFYQRLAFSHLYTGLDLSGISEFLQIAPKESETDSPVPDERIQELGELCTWLYGNKREKIPPVVKSQNPDLRRLNAVVAHREAIASLRAGDDLAHAFEISRPSDAVFEEALLAAKRALTTAISELTTGYDKSEALIKIAGSVANLADDIYTEMERKRNGSKKKQRLSE